MYISSISVDAVIDALVAFLTPFMQGGQIVRGQVNRVPLPGSPCAVLTEISQSDIDVPYVTNDDVLQQITIYGPKKIDIQIDFYGSIAGELCAVTKSAFRSGYGFDVFPSNIKPLYTSDGMQAPLTTGEQQYESRWTLTAFMQYNPTVIVPQQSAIVASVDKVVPVDIFDQLN